MIYYVTVIHRPYPKFIVWDIKVSGRRIGDTESSSLYIHQLEIGNSVYNEVYTGTLVTLRNDYSKFSFNRK